MSETKTEQAAAELRRPAMATITAQSGTAALPPAEILPKAARPVYERYLARRVENAQWAEQVKPYLPNFPEQHAAVTAAKKLDEAELQEAIRRGDEELPAPRHLQEYHRKEREMLLEHGRRADQTQTNALLEEIDRLIVDNLDEGEQYAAAIAGPALKRYRKAIDELEAARTNYFRARSAAGWYEQLRERLSGRYALPRRNLGNGIPYGTRAPSDLRFAERYVGNVRTFADAFELLRREVEPVEPTVSTIPNDWANRVG